MFFHARGETGSGMIKASQKSYLDVKFDYMHLTHKTLS